MTHNVGPAHHARAKRVARIRARHMRIKQRAIVAAAVFVTLAGDERIEADQIADEVLP